MIFFCLFPIVGRLSLDQDSNWSIIVIKRYKEIILSSSTHHFDL